MGYDPFPKSSQVLPFRLHPLSNEMAGYFLNRNFCYVLALDGHVRVFIEKGPGVVVSERAEERRQRSDVRADRRKRLLLIALGIVGGFWLVAFIVGRINRLRTSRRINRGIESYLRKR